MDSEKLTFGGVHSRDVYNITAPFQYAGHTVIAGRVEKRDEELSEIVFFHEIDSAWIPLPNAPRFPGLQDPCITRIDGQLLLGGVRFPVKVGVEDHAWQMAFYIETDDASFQPIFTGPPKMEDIRFVQLPDERVVVFTRPQGAIGGRGKIGFFVAESEEALNVQAIEAAPLLEGLCAEEEWVGANEAHVLSDTKLGVLGHIAHFSEDGDRHYYAMAFVLDIETGEATKPQIIAKRADFPAGASKRPDLVDVIFSGGLQRLPNGRARLYAGLSDAEAGYVEIADPFHGLRDA